MVPASGLRTEAMGERYIAEQLAASCRGSRHGAAGRTRTGRPPSVATDLKGTSTQVSLYTDMGTEAMMSVCPKGRPSTTKPH